MTLLFSASCFIIAFTPAFLVFFKVVAKDPLRVILFVLGGFFWLVSLLISSLVWWIIGGHLLPAIIVSVIAQEVGRFLYFLLLHKAQTGLAKLASNGVEVSSIRLLYSSRHVLAIVCGLGMGVVAALFLLVNILADYSHDGIVGLPSAVFPDSDGHNVKLYLSDARFPLFYSLSCSMLVVFHICWTVSLWDGAHKALNRLGAWCPGVFSAFFFHFAIVGVSMFMKERTALSLALQALLLVANLVYCYAVIRTPTWLPAWLSGHRATPLVLENDAANAQ
ncbi:Protein APH-1 [Aphelenchoides avenae]|nr:Protein APH-1 [Aphelenchus avenae]